MSLARRERLDNGLVVVAHESRAARSIALRLVLPAGAAFDPEDKEGTASLVAALLDRGAGGLSAEAIADFFDFLGVSCIAAARRDSLEIEIRLLSEHLPAVLDRLRLIVCQPEFPEAEVRREKGKALTAIAERDQDTAAVAEMSVAAALFPAGHPYRRPLLGTRESVPRIERHDLAAFHRGRVLPAGSVLCLAGDLDPARAIDLVAKTFGAWKAEAAAPPEPAVADPPPPERPVVVVRPLEGKTQADLALAFRGPARVSPDLPAALVLNNILGEFALGGRLGKAIRDRAGLAYYVYSRLSPGRRAGPFVVRAGVAPERVRRALDLMRRTIEGIVRRGVTTSELRDSRRALAASVPRRLETNPEAAAVLAEAEFYGLGIDYPERLPRLFEAVTKAEADAAARTYLTLGRHVLVLAGPALEKEALT